MAFPADPKLQINMAATSIPKDSSSLLAHLSLFLSFISKGEFWHEFSIKIWLENIFYLTDRKLGTFTIFSLLSHCQLLEDQPRPFVRETGLHLQTDLEL